MEIKNVSKEAATETNANGGMQSTTAYAMHLLDPSFIQCMFNNQKGYITTSILHLVDFMRTEDKFYIYHAVWALRTDMCIENLDVLLVIAEVLKEGAQKYAPNNWRLIPQEEHINHALIHLFAHLKGNKEDNHLAHAMCRLMMAYATEKSPNFSYTKYIPQEKENK